MERSHGRVTAKVAVVLTFAVAVLSVVVGLFHIAGVATQGPLAAYVPQPIRRTVGFTGTITGFTLLAGAYALRRGLQVGWYAATILIPLTVAQGLLGGSPLSVLLVGGSALCLPTLALNRAQFSRPFHPSPPQLAAGIALVTALSYGTVGSYALREEFTGLSSIVDAFYFTIVTASTVGYGDITPVSGIGRMFGLSVLLVNVAAFAVALGVLLTPAIEAQFSKALGRMTTRQFELLNGHVLVLGYGDMTEPILEELAKRTDFVVITPDETVTRRLTDQDISVLTADPSDESPLRRAQVGDARAVLAATNDDAQDALAILTARELNPDIRIVAAATQRENVTKLRRAGADSVISPALIGGHLLVESALGDETTEATAASLLEDHDRRQRVEDEISGSGTDGSGESAADPAESDRSLDG